MNQRRRLRWGVFIVGLDPVAGHEQGGERRALVVSYEPFHGSGLATVCPITTRQATYPNEVVIPAGEAGQTENGVILCHQVRTVSVMRFQRLVGFVLDPRVRGHVRQSLARHLGLDVPGSSDGATGSESIDSS
ncbi:MAG: type II toxin-antitoxin system PemK/MazF family toxin [Actinomycetota bacterium]|nr:type II toxin-antitoxin system PemK/MazF family toxin [Actinomycetota bacterium]